jgi:hypothetical protein
LAVVSLRALFSEAAWALLRPSAIASAKLAKSRVSHSQMVTARMKADGASPVPTTAWTHRMVVRMLPMYTTNITGLRIWYRGVNRRKLSASAAFISAGSMNQESVPGFATKVVMIRGL